MYVVSLHTESTDSVIMVFRDGDGAGLVSIQKRVYLRCLLGSDSSANAGSVILIPKQGPVRTLTSAL